MNMSANENQGIDKKASNGKKNISNRASVIRVLNKPSSKKILQENHWNDQFYQQQLQKTFRPISYPPSKRTKSSSSLPSLYDLRLIYDNATPHENNHTRVYLLLQPESSLSNNTRVIYFWSQEYYAF